MKRTTILMIATLAFGAAAPNCQALFGFGKKTEEEQPSEKKTPLPGMESGGLDLTQPPRMAQEAEPPPSSLPDAPVSGEAPSDESSSVAPVSETETAIGEHPAGDASSAREYVIKGQGGAKVKFNKQPLNIDVDPFESIRDSLVPDQGLLLAESPLSVVWRRTHPEFLRSSRVIQPWLTTFSDRPGIIFRPLDELGEALQRRIGTKEGRGYEWSLTIADEEGKVFQRYEGTGRPPEEVTWSGQNDQGDWITAGAAYSPIYVFTEPGGTPLTRVGKPIRFQGVVHQERNGLLVTLDSAVLFGRAKGAETLQGAQGADLIRSCADAIKRKYSGMPIRVEVYAGSKELAERQALEIEAALIKELMLLPQDISTDALATPYAEQRVEIVLLNR
ncbi:MAG: hypothetical protein WC728_09455 [Elusimicrobiota bacterium]